MNKRIQILNFYDVLCSAFFFSFSSLLSCITYLDEEKKKVTIARPLLFLPSHFQLGK